MDAMLTENKALVYVFHKHKQVEHTKNNDDERFLRLLVGRVLCNALTYRIAEEMSDPCVHGEHRKAGQP